MNVAMKKDTVSATKKPKLTHRRNRMEIGFCGLLTLVFITLKLTDVIAWSWLWVLSPLWISALVAFFILFVYGMFVTWYKR